ncbi:MAG: smc 7 [Phycisphaerales bacterium]|nr:smc 7 [Phycisphaerales bacterium]
MTPQLTQGLAALRRRLLAIGLVAGTGWGIAVAVAALVAWMWLDLVLDFTGPVRAAASWLSLLCGLALLARAAFITLGRGTARALAQRLDAVAGSRGQILAGVDLSQQQHAGAVSAGLAAIAVERAGVLAHRIAPAQAAPARDLRWPITGAGAILAAVGLVALLAPRLAGTQWARFTDPFGDHPPFSRVTLNVEPGDVRIVYGQGFDIRVSADGGPLDKAEVVLLADGSGNADDVLPMFGEGQNKWRATVAGVTAATKYYVRAPGSRSRKYNVELITVPKLEGVRVRITPPAYTNRPPYDGVVPQGGFAGLAGTKIELFAKSNRPLSGGTVEFEGGPTIAMTGAGNEATAAFKLEKAGKLTLHVTDTAGQPSTDSFSAPLTLLQDERPFVRLAQPLPNSFATPSTNLPIEIIAEDDYGLSRVEIFRSLNDSRALPMALAIPTPAPTRYPAGIQLPLKKFGLKPGDEIKVYARVEDNDPAGAKGSESNIATVKIISESDYKRMVIAREGMEVLQSKYAQAQRRMEAMAEEIQKLKEEIAKKEEVDPETLKKLQELSEKLEQEAAEVQKTADEDLPFDIDKKLKTELDQVAKKLEEAAKEAAQLAKNKGQGIPKITGALDELAKKLGAGQQQFKEEAMEPLEHLAKIFPLIEDEARFLLVHEQQKELAERLASLKDKEHVDDPKAKARMRDMEEEQRKLRDELRNILDDIEQHLIELPDDEKLQKMKDTAADFAKAVRESAANDRMQDAEQGLADFNGTKGHANAKEAEEILDSFISKCRGMGDGAGQCLVFNPKLAGGMGNTVEQLLDAEGLSTGRGGAGGSGGGYMSKRSTLRNVGIYGDLARLAKASKSGGGKSEKGVSTDGRGGLDDKGNPLGVDASAKGRTAGEADATVPVQYKRRVGDYFRRVADEIGDK